MAETIVQHCRGWFKTETFFEAQSNWFNISHDAEAKNNTLIVFEIPKKNDTELIREIELLIQSKLKT